jgi:hypothetical protein
MEICRLSVLPKDVQRILGKSLCSARRILHRIKAAFGKKSHQLITPHEFAMYYGLPVETVMSYISDGKHLYTRVIRAESDPASLDIPGATVTSETLEVKQKRDPYQTIARNPDMISAVEMAVQMLITAVKPAEDLIDDELHDKLVRFLIRLIPYKGEGMAGQHPVLVSMMKPEFRLFDLNTKISFLRLFAAEVTTSHRADRKSATVQIRNIQLSEMLSSSPIDATHFKLFHLAATVTDIVFDKKDSTYRFSNRSFTSDGAVSESDYFSLAADPVDVSLTTMLPNKRRLSKSITVIQALGIAFYTRINGQTFQYETGKAMHIIDVF